MTLLLKRQNNDGKQDLVGVWASGIMTAYLNNGTPGHPGFGTQMDIGTDWNSITRIVVVDADNDGKQDLLGVWPSGIMTAYVNTGTRVTPASGPS